MPGVINFTLVTSSIIRMRIRVKLLNMTNPGHEKELLVVSLSAYSSKRCVYINFWIKLTMDMETAWLLVYV